MLCRRETSNAAMYSANSLNMQTTHAHTHTHTHTHTRTHRHTNMTIHHKGLPLKKTHSSFSFKLSMVTVISIDIYQSICLKVSGWPYVKLIYNSSAMQTKNNKSQGIYTLHFNT